MGHGVLGSAEDHGLCSLLLDHNVDQAEQEKVEVED